MQSGFLELSQILGRRAVTAEQAAANRKTLETAIAAGRRITPPLLRPRPAVPALLPISKSSWWSGIAAGKYPKAVRVYGRSLWRASDIAALLERLGQGGSK
jgi:predicted DNA-binding transcriptional regulator AlpA